ncbi:hypothetical protein FOZ61_008236, partial [Perkinsus olseni]
MRLHYALLGFFLLLLSFQCIEVFSAKETAKQAAVPPDDDERAPAADESGVDEEEDAGPDQRGVDEEDEEGQGDDIEHDAGDTEHDEGGTGRSGDADGEHTKGDIGRTGEDTEHSEEDAEHSEEDAEHSEEDAERSRGLDKGHTGGRAERSGRGADEQPIEQKPASDPLDLRILDDEAEAGERQSNLLSLAGSFINRAYMRLGFVAMLRSYELQLEKELKVLNAVVDQIIAQGKDWIEELKTFPEMQNEVIARHKENIEDVRARFERVMPKTAGGAATGGDGQGEVDEAIEGGDEENGQGLQEEGEEEEADTPSPAVFTSEVCRRFISAENLKVLEKLLDGVRDVPSSPNTRAVGAFWEYALMCFSIPRPSTDFDGTAKFSRLDPIRECLRAVAEANGWVYHTDSAGNVYLRSSSSHTPAAVLLQGHLDIVCSQNASAKHDFEKDPINVRMSEDGQWLRAAKETTLGADNGVGMAGALAALTVMPQDPPLEVILTANEETNFEGAEGADPKLVTASRMINLDSEEGGEICIGSAGGFEHKFWLSLQRAPAPDGFARYRLSLRGFLGGHSGIDIAEERLNCIKVLRKLLCTVTSPSVLIEGVEGGTGPNAIPREASAVIVTSTERWPDVERSLNECFQEMLRECPLEIAATLELVEDPSASLAEGTLTVESAGKLLCLVEEAPHGVIEFEEGTDGELKTSCNLGVVRSTERNGESCAMVHVFPRSTSMEAMCSLGKDFTKLGDKFNAVNENNLCPFPGWEPDRSSELLKVVSSTCPVTSDPRIYTIHAGLECGTLMSRLLSVKECVSIGPTVKGAHSPDERLEIASCGPFIQWVCEVTERFLSCDEHAGYFSGGSTPHDAHDIERICRSTYNEHATRKAIMQLLAFAVSPSAASWRNILAGLELLEHLLEKGSMELWRECARGEHFDASQRLLFLSTYTNPDDPRVTKLIRTKARMIREKVMAKNEQVESMRVSAPERTTRGHASSSADSTERASSSSENEEPSKDTEAEASMRACVSSKNPSTADNSAFPVGSISDEIEVYESYPKKS